MRDPVLVIMAAGMGSRFGSLKQITPVDPQGHKIIDFSLYDARRAGFGKVIFIIKESIDTDFRQAVGDRMEKYFDVCYVYQELDRLPVGFSVPPGRVKPWGTAHAIACAADDIDGPFAVMNADDYYGSTAVQSLFNFLVQERGPTEHAMVGYRLRNTLSDHGSVSRGVCRVEDGMLSEITEYTQIEKAGTDIVCTQDGKRQALSPDALVSMNLWAFQRDVLPEFKYGFPAFLREHLQTDPLKCEYYLPSVVEGMLKNGLGTVRVLPTDEVWHGVTYAEDLEDVRRAVSDMKARGLYPEYLWEEGSV